MPTSPARRDPPLVSFVQREQPRFHFLEGEGLDEVVIRSVLESCQLVVERVARREHQYGPFDFGLAAQLAAQLESIHARQRDIEQYAVELLGDREVQAGDAVGRHVHAMPAAAQEVAEIGRDRDIVFDDEEAHWWERRGVRVRL